MPSLTPDRSLSSTPSHSHLSLGLPAARPKSQTTPNARSNQRKRTRFFHFDLEPSNEAVQQTSDSLRASFRLPRRHAAFRATDIVDYFYTNLASDYTSSRLVGRSVANTNWKIAIPAKSLLADESEGMARFIRSVKDIKLHLKTYSYSGN